MVVRACILSEKTRPTTMNIGKTLKNKGIKTGKSLKIIINRMRNKGLEGINGKATIFKNMEFVNKPNGEASYARAATS